MLVALYVGDHAADSLAVRAGWAITRAVQRGDYKQVTHVEAILCEHGTGEVDIASASLRDGGVRIKRTRLNPDHWLIASVPAWDAARSAEWFAAHAGQPYDVRGALATVLPGHHDGGGWFCNESVGASVDMASPHSLGPAQFAAVALSPCFGRNLTASFFLDRQ